MPLSQRNNYTLPLSDINSPQRRLELSVFTKRDRTEERASLSPDLRTLKVSLQESTKKINDRMQEDNKKYNSKIKLLSDITYDHLDNENGPSVIEESKTAFNLTLARIGTMLGQAKKNYLEPKTPYTFVIEPVGAVFFEIPCYGRPSPIILRTVNDTDGCGIGLAKGQDVHIYWSKFQKNPSLEDNDGCLFQLNKLIKVSSSQGTTFSSKKIYFAIYSISGIRVRIGFGWKTDVFPNNSLYAEERMRLLAGDLEGAQRISHFKEFTVDDFFPD